ncbi:MAG: preprotein translocase subunit SecG [Rhodospirillaceae bacterium]|nr:preprotein translocase subunit SecG [Rhodospirillaceae bacterium]|tara:strand:- start:197 stop:511 length:315 start_codon:yes stop_codon:yes gene_type:complete
MEKIILVIHLFLAIGLVVTVLLQKSEGGALGIGGSGGGGGLVSVRSSANFLTRATAIMAGCFLLTSLTLAILAGAHNKRGINLDSPATTGEATEPAVPTVPLSK